MGSPYPNTFNYEETYQTNLSQGETNTRPSYRFQEGDFGMQKYKEKSRGSNSTYSPTGTGSEPPDTLTQTPFQLSLEKEILLQVLHYRMARINVKLNKLASLSALSSVNEPGVPTKGKEIEIKEPEKDLCLEKHFELNMGKLTSISPALSISSKTLICSLDFVVSCDAGKGEQEKDDSAIEEVMEACDGENVSASKTTIEEPSANERSPICVEP
ncbi:uncharacterized protein G2W53_022253 [Senna tora]|uniref:Uncharacterized protein n=1 Tax=Senna tora TaxID=362788 RepID=A0A834TMN8_9FABA|nr:uncharacterized protein G2W53_022253 [Senna tora]